MRTRTSCKVAFFATCASAILLASSGCIWTSFLDYTRRVQEALDAVPAVHVRIVNQTGVPARVTFDAGITPPEGQPGYYADLVVNTLLQTGTKDVVVAAGGTVEGTIKCGEVIGVSVLTPGDGSVEDYYGNSEQAFGLYMYGGDITLTGAGSAASADSDFAGDVQNTGTVRFIRKTEDAVNCDTSTIVIDIQTAGTPGNYDSETGTWTNAVLGTGVVTIE